MSKDAIEKAEKKARKEKKRLEAEAAAAAGSAPVLALDADLVGKADVEMADGEATSVAVVEKSKTTKEAVVIPIEELSPIAHPLAAKKLNKKLHKVIKKASKMRQVKRGVKEVVKAVRKGEKGILILAGDITPVDIISHLPVMAEEAGIPYVFVASKEELGHASATKRSTSCVLICPDSKVKQRKKKEGEPAKDEEEEDYREVYDECFKEIKELDENIAY